jgi:ABC-2 type transport system permease protein
MSKSASKIFAIIRREYIERVRTRAFVIGTLATPVLMLAFSVLPIFLAASGGGGQRRVTVLDQGGDPALFETIKRRVEGPDSETSFVLSQVVVPPDADIDELRKQHNPEVLRDSDNAYIVLRSGVLDGVEPHYYAKNPSDFGLRRMERAISAAITERRLVGAGFDAEKVTQYMRPVDLKTIKVTPEGETEERGQAFIVALVMLIFIYMTILTYGISVMRGVIEEKQSRIVEVVISSVRPFQMMMGKLLGIGMVGLTQYTIWVLSAVALTVFGASMFDRSGFPLPHIPISLFIYFVVFFVLGYFLFATLYTIVGAMVSSEDDAQQAQFPVTMLIVVPMAIFWLVMRDPNSTMAITLSMIPFFAPTLMMLRIAMVSPPLWQVLLSMGLMVAAIIAAVWVAAKIYRVGILMYGKRPSLAELGRWIRYAT